MIFEQFALAVFSLFFFSTVCSLAFQKNFFTTSVIFSGIWSVVVLGKYYVNRFVGDDQVSSYSYELLLQGIVGMITGCVVAQILLGRPRFKADHIAARYNAIHSFVIKIFPFIFWTTLLSGMVAFYLDGRGFNFRFDDLGAVREDYLLSESGNLPTQLARYVLNLTFAGAIILALSDYQRGKFSIIRLILLCIAVLPLSLTKASRLEFVLVALHYFSAVLLLLTVSPLSRVQLRLKRVFLRKQMLQGVILIALVAFVFSILGLVRSAGKTVYEDVDGFMEAFLYPIAAYISGSIYSVGPVSEWIELNIGPSFGSRYFEFFYKFLEPIGLEYFNSKLIVRSAYNEIGSISIRPGTFVRYLVSDFGSRYMPYAAFVIGALSTLVVLRANVLNLITFGFSTLVVFELVYSFQVIGLFTVDQVYKLVVLATVSYAFERYRRRINRGAE